MNTINICLGHQPFPHQYTDYIDLMIGPMLVESSCKFALVPDSAYGPHGSALSEYAQLLWLSDNLPQIAGSTKFIRIFQYRRFCSAFDRPEVGQVTTNQPWSRAVTQEDLSAYKSDFDRYSEAELFNSVITFADWSMLGHYASVHVLDDLLNFARYLNREGIMDAVTTARFLNSKSLIPACNIGVFSVDTFHWMYSIMKRAAGFMQSEMFVPRDGYQRRTMGFLLERLNSFLIEVRTQSGQSPANFGYNIIISDTPTVVPTQ